MSKTDRTDDLKGIKICRVSTVSFYLVSQLRNQAEYLRDRGMNVNLVSSDGPELSELTFGRGLSHHVIDIPRSVDLVRDLIALGKLVRFFMTHKFDIVHSTTPKAGLLTSLAAFFTGVPVRLHTWTGQQWVGLRGPLRWSCRSADRLIAALSTHCYADSKSQRQFLIDEKIVGFRKISVIGHGSLAGVDLGRFRPDRLTPAEKLRLRKSLAIAEGSKVFVFIGRISRDKGITELISAFSTVADAGYNADLLLVGPLDQECGGRCSVELAGMKQNPHIHYAGYQKVPEDYLAISDVFCIPSYREGFGTTVIEAAAMGLPTIGTRINGLVDAVMDGQTGILVPVADENALASAMRGLLDDPGLIRKLGEAARKRCVELFDAKVLNGKLTEEYSGLLKARGVRGNRI